MDESRLADEGDEFERALLSAGRDERMSPAARAALRSMADGAATGLVAAGAAAAGKAVAKGSGLALWMKYVGLVVVASGVATAIVRTRTIVSVNPASEGARAAGEPGPAPARPPRTIASSSAEEAPSIASSSPEAVTVSTPAPAEVPLPAVHRRASTLTEEARLVEAARSADARGDSAEALRLLDKHAAAFPAGALEEEATVIRAEVLARIDPAAGRDLAASYLRTHPESPYRGRLTPLLESP
jgi:hypothetical protein